MRAADQLIHPLRSFLALPILSGSPSLRASSSGWASLTPSAECSRQPRHAETRICASFPCAQSVSCRLLAVCLLLSSLFGAVHTSGSNQALLTNAVIPVTMLLSVLILHHRFLKREYAGSLIIMCGIFTVLLPQLFPSEPSFSSERDSGGDIGQDDNSDLPLFNFLFLLSVVPSALSSLYKEMAFLDSDIDSNYLQAWVSLWQTVFGFALIPLNTLSFLGPQAVRWDELLSSFVDGGWCLLGYNLVRPPHCTPHHVPSERLRTCDDCHGAWLPIALYVVFNVLFNVFTVLLIKYGSATLMFVIMTLRMPLVQLAFSMKQFNDPPDSFGFSAASGLVVILAGLVCYRWPVKRKRKAGAGEEGKGEDGHLLRLEDGALPPLQRAKTTGGLAGGDYQLEAERDEAEARLIMPMMGGHNYNSFFAARHNRHHELIRLKRSDSEIRGSYFSKLGMPASPFLGRKSPQPASSGAAGGGRAGRGDWAGSPLLGGSSRSRTPPITYGSALGERKEES